MLFRFKNETKSARNSSFDTNKNTLFFCFEKNLGIECARYAEKRIIEFKIYAYIITNIQINLQIGMV